MVAEATMFGMFRRSGSIRVPVAPLDGLTRQNERIVSGENLLADPQTSKEGSRPGIVGQAWSMSYEEGRV
jgi:hypothetical protein